MLQEHFLGVQKFRNLEILLLKIKSNVNNLSEKYFFQKRLIPINISIYFYRPLQDKAITKDLFKLYYRIFQK